MCVVSPTLYSYLTDLLFQLFTQSSTQELMGKTDEEAARYYYGCRFWHPKWLQVLASAKFYTFCFCFIATIQGALVSGK